MAARAERADGAEPHETEPWSQCQSTVSECSSSAREISINTALPHNISLANPLIPWAGGSFAVESTGELSGLIWGHRERSTTNSWAMESAPSLARGAPTPRQVFKP
jgi:hypothetical protein